MRRSWDVEPGAVSTLVTQLINRMGTHGEDAHPGERQSGTWKPRYNFQPLTHSSGRPA
jgi:hypothetical protein